MVKFLQLKATFEDKMCDNTIFELLKWFEVHQVNFYWSKDGIIHEYQADYNGECFRFYN